MLCNSQLKTHIKFPESNVGCFTSFMKYVHLQVQSRPKEHHNRTKNKLVNTNTVIYIQNHTLNCTLRHEVLLMQYIIQQKKKQCTENHCPCRWNLSMTPPRQMTASMILFVVENSRIWD